LEINVSISEILPLAFLLAGAFLIFGGTELARRAKLPEAIGSGATLWLIAVGLGLFATNWRAWVAGDAGGDRLLTYARLVGLTGMFFLAGTTFRAQNIRRTRIAGFAALSALLLIITTLLFISLANQPVGTAAFIAASFVSSSLWFPAAFRTSENDRSVAANLSGAIAFTATVMFGAYLAEVLSAIPAARNAATTFAIVTLYELVKLAVVFGFAYFISTRFLARAHGRVSQVRTQVGFILIAILFFALISLAAGTIASMAWAFIAGALWRKTDFGDEFGKRPKPIASALLVSLVFLSLLLQVHGRELSFSRGVIVAAAVAIALKVLSTWFLLRRDSNENREALFVSAAMAFPGEIALLFLSIAVTRFVIDGPIFFASLAYAFFSALLIPALLFVANNRRLRAAKQPREPIYQG
jgi:Kef-type K+ transport system membrane component KefB